MLWFDGGLQFSCLRCHGCCTNHGDNKWVYVTSAERKDIAKLLDLELDKLESNYCVPKGDGMVLRFRDRRCPFLDDEGCRINEAKPIQCSSWPFWSENIYSKHAWERKVVNFCPGAGQGRLWSRDEIEEQARRSRG